MAITPLLTLSPEMLLAICQTLCTHCGRKSSGPPSFSKEANENLAALSCLSRTCKTLRAVAQPVLYHMPWVIKRETAALARTIVQRPDLAQQVQELASGPDLWIASFFAIINDEDRKLFEAEMGSQAVYNSQGDLISPICRWEADNIIPPADGSELHEYMAQDFLSVLILSKTPNLKQFTLEGGFPTRLPFLRPNMLPNLTTIRYLSWEGTGINLDSITGLLVAAPALEKLHCHSLWASKLTSREGGKFCHENINTVAFEWSTLVAEDLESTMNVLPNLTTFRYQSGGPTVNEMGEATPAEISAALLGRRDTLRTVSINLDEAFFPDDIDEDQVMSGLADMKVLENLELCGRCVYVETDDDTTTDGTLLTNLLPSSLQVFALDKPHEHIYQDILQLAAEAADNFPRLKKVMIRDVDEGQADVFRQAFASSGIEYIHNGVWSEFNHRN